MSDEEKKADFIINKAKVVEVEDKVEKSIPERIPAFGLLVALLGVVCFSSGTFLVKIITSLNPLEILAFRCLFQIIVFLIIILINKTPIFVKPEFRWALFLRCASGTVTLTSIYVSYRLMPLPDATSIHFSSPVFVTVFAYFMLKEPLTILEGITGLIAIFGVFIISKPEFLFGSENESVYENRNLGTVLAVIGTICTAFSMITLRKLKTTSASVIIVWYSVMIVLVCILLLIAMNDLVLPKGLKTWCLLLAAGLCGVFGQYFKTISFRYEKAGPISVVLTFNIVLSFVWEVVFLKESIDWTSVLGASMISFCVIILAVVKWKSESPQWFSNLFRKLFCRSVSG